MRTAFIVVLFGAVAVTLAGCDFAPVAGTSAESLPGFFSGLWHGLLAPWSLVLRLFMNIGMYAYPNSGWFYDLGFLLGVAGSLPIGWLVAIIALVVHVI
jgi:hypothetical protein